MRAYYYFWHDVFYIAEKEFGKRERLNMMYTQRGEGRLRDGEIDATTLIFSSKETNEDGVTDEKDEKNSFFLNEKSNGSLGGKFTTAPISVRLSNCNKHYHHTRTV